MSDIAEQLNEAAKKATRASAQAEAWATGPVGTTVPTDSGPVPTIAEFTRANQERADNAIAHLNPQIRESIRRSYAEAGYNLVAGSFEAGGTVTTATDVLLYEAEGKAYAWGGTLPKTVPVGSTPSSSGGIGASAWLDASAGYSFAADIKSLLARPISNSIVTVGGYHIGSKIGGGEFRYDAAMPKSKHNGGTIISRTVPWDGSQLNLTNFLNGIGETDPSGLGCWVRKHGYDVFVSWFGAVGDAARPSSGAPDGDPTGTDDTGAIAACRDYMQEVAFQPNFFVGFWGGYRMNFEPNRCYRVKGHNPLGSSRPRNSDENPTGNVYRQNWFIQGNAALIVWEVQTEDDCFIEAYEAFSRQLYSNFSVIVAKAVGKMGVFYSNVANPGRNATAIHKFDRVDVYHAMPSSDTHGLKYMFRYLGNNLGDRLITEQCSFNQAHTMFYSENGESVQQGFKSTTFASYLDNSIMFHLRRHGSTFNFSSGCGFLLKGNNATLLRTEFLPGSEGGSNGSNQQFDITGSRLECRAGKLQTLANLDYGVLNISGISMAPGGLPLPESYMFITRKTGVVIANSCHLYGRLAVGAKDTNNTTVRAYGIKLTNCHFSNDVAAQMYVETAVGSIPSEGTYVAWKDAVIGNYPQTPPIIIDGTNTRTATFQGLTADTRIYAFDGVYAGTSEYITSNVSRKTIIGRYRPSSGYYYLDNRDYIVLPPLSTITSVKLTHGTANTTQVDKFRFSVGAAQLDYSPVHNTTKREVEMLAPNQVIIISDDDVTQRTVSLSMLLANVQVENPSQIGHIEITYRPAFGKHEITTAVDANNIRLSRLTT